MNTVSAEKRRVTGAFPRLPVSSGFLVRHHASRQVPVARLKDSGNTAK